MRDQVSPQARDFLLEPRFAVLATIHPDGTPQQSTIWYELQGDKIIMNTRRGRVKERNMRRDPRVSFCVENTYQYVAVRGTVELIDDQEIAKADIYRLSARYHDPATAERQARDQFRQEARVTIRLRIERVDEYGFD